MAVGSPVAHLAGELEFCVADRVWGTGTDDIVEVDVKVVTNPDQLQSRNTILNKGGGDGFQ